MAIDTTRATIPATPSRPAPADPSAQVLEGALDALRADVDAALVAFCSTSTRFAADED